MQVDRAISEPASNTADGNPHLKLTDAEYNRIISLRFETTSNSASLLHDRFRARVDELELELKEKQEQLKAAINEKFNAENEKETLVSRLHVEAQERAKVISRIQQIDKYCEIVKSSYSSTIRKHSALEAEISDVNSDFENTFSAIKAAHVQFKSLLTEAAQQKDELKRENSSLTAQISVLREQEIQSEYKLQQGDCLLSAERKKATDLSAKIHTLEKKIEQGIAEAGRLLSVKERTENLFNQQAAKLVECQNEAHALRTLNQQLLCDLNVSSQQREKHERDMSVLLERCDSFTKQIEQLQGENKKLNHELLAEAEASALSKRALMNTTEQKNLEIEALNEQLGMMKCDAKKVTDERDKLSAIVIDTQARLTDLERDRDAGKTLLAESNIRETQLQAENAAFCERLKVLEQEVGSRMAQLNEQKTTFDGLIEKHLAENRERCTSIENELQQSNSRIESLSSTLSLSNEKVTRLEKENADLHESLTTLQSKLACSVPVEEYNKKVREVDECRRELADVKRSSTVDKQICSLNFSSPITRPVADVNATKNSTTTLV